MKRLISLISALIIGSPMICQNTIEVCSWDCHPEHVKGQIWRLVFTAKMADGWHLYSQTQRDNAIALPTSFSFAKCGSYKEVGECYENGRIIFEQDTSIGISARYYEDSVEFRQTIKVLTPPPFKMDINAIVEFQVCTKEKCLPPDIRRFNIKIQQ